MDRKILGLLGAVAIVASACSAGTTSPSAAPERHGPERIRLGARRPPPRRRPRSTSSRSCSATTTSPRPARPVAASSCPTGRPPTSSTRSSRPRSPTRMSWRPRCARCSRSPPTATGSPTSRRRCRSSATSRSGSDSDGKGFEMDIELKPGLLWSDGVPLTLNDLKYTWQWVNDPDQVGVTTTGWDSIDKIDVSHRRAQGDGPLQGAVRGLLRPVRHVVPARALDEDDPDQGRRVEVVPVDRRTSPSRRRTVRSSTRTPRPTRSSSSATTTGRPATTRPTSTRSRSSTTRTTRRA